MILHPVSSVGGEGISPTHPANSWTPAGCPTFQLNSDTIYPETASVSTGRVQSYEVALPACNFSINHNP